MIRTDILLIWVLAVALTCAPVRFDVLDPKRPLFEVAKAFAKSGKGSGGANDDEDDDEDDDDEDDESSNSGSGSGNSGSGSGNSGSGNSGSGGGNSGSGSGSGGAGGGTQSGNGAGATPETGSDPVFKSNGIVERIIVTSKGIEIRYSDGFREEISGGTYVVRDNKGRSVIKRRAKGSDISRLKAIASRVSIRSVIRGTPTHDDVEEVTRKAKDLSVRYANGWTERISGTSYQLIDPYARTVALRAVTRSDRDRLNGLAANY